MHNFKSKIDSLDIKLFDAIPSQSTDGCRISFLAVQRMTREKGKLFSYLEIGSHLGGTIQPYLLDDKCIKIFSVDPRPASQPDDRMPGYIYYYENNSSERMKGLLASLDAKSIEKVECFDTDVAGMEINSITIAPEVVLIDGEHTHKAVMADFAFCQSVASSTCTILFHDFNIIYPAINLICKQLEISKKQFVPLKLDGAVFAIFFDKDKIFSDPYLTSVYHKNRYYFRKFLLKEKIKKNIPLFLLKLKRRYF
jgi:hypothetical protein